MQDAPTQRRGHYPLMYVGRRASQIERDYGRRLGVLAREGFDVHVLAADDGGFAELSKRGVQSRPLPVGYRANVPGLLGAFFIMQGYFIEKEPVLVHCHDDVLLWLGSLAARRARVPAVFATVEEHLIGPSVSRIEFETLMPFPPKLAALLEEIVEQLVGETISGSMESAYRLLGRWVDKYLVTNEFDLQRLDDRDLVPPNKLETIIGGRGIDLADYSIGRDDFPTTREAREMFGIPARWRRVVGFAGRLTRRGGADDLLESIRATRESHPAAGWLVGIEQSSRSAYRHRLDEWEQQGRVRVVEIPATRAHFYRALDVLVSPAHSGAIASGLMEAAATRVPGIGYRRTGASSVIVDGQTGRLVPLGDTSALTEAVRGALDHPKRWRDFGMRARGRCSQRFNREHVDDQVMRLYDTVLETKLQSQAPE